MSKRNFMLFPGFCPKAVTLNYDDGVRQDKRLIDIMLKHGLKGTFNVNSGLFSKDFNEETSGRMTIEEAVSLYKESKMEVGAHGYKHLPIGNLPKSVVNNEIAIDLFELEKIFNCIVKGMAYSFGHFSNEIIDVLETCGVNYSRTTISTEKFNIPENWLCLNPTCHHNNPRLLELVDEFLNMEFNKYDRAKEPLLFCLWGHSYEFDRDNNWSIIEEFASRISAKNNIWYATCGEIYNYVKAFDSLEYSVDGSTVFNPSGQTIYYDNYGKHYAIKPLETVKVGSKSIF